MGIDSIVVWTFDKIEPLSILVCSKAPALKRVYTTRSIHSYLMHLPRARIGTGNKRGAVSLEEEGYSKKSSIAEEIHVTKKEWKKWLASME